MIQRIQHVFLMLAVVLNVAFVFTPLFERALEDPAMWIVSGIATGIAISTLLNLYVIALFKRRVQQMTWLRRGLVFQVLALGLCVGIFFSMGGIRINLWDEGASALLPLGALALMAGALIYIRKDEHLVRSMDRLR